MTIGPLVKMARSSVRLIVMPESVSVQPLLMWSTAFVPLFAEFVSHDGALAQSVFTTV